MDFKISNAYLVSQNASHATKTKTSLHPFSGFCSSLNFVLIELVCN